MQAIILAAGMGKRLGTLTKENTKCMVSVNGVKLIDRLLGQLSKLSLSKVVIVVGYEAKKLIDYIGNRYDNSLQIEYVHNDVYYKTNNIYSLMLASDRMVEEDTLLIESDLIFDDRLFSLITEHPYPNLALVAKYQSWMDGTMVQLNEENYIVNFITKSAFKYEDADTYYKTVNIYKFSKEFARNRYVPFLHAYCKAMGNNEYYEQVLKVITYLDNSELKALPIGNEKWYEIDDIQDLDIAECIFAEDNDKLAKINSRYGGYWRFPGMIDYCYLVNPYFPTRRMMDEIRSNFDALLTEYPSGLRVNSLIASKCFKVSQQYIIPGNGAAELINILMNTLNGKMGVMVPTFEEYVNRKCKDDIELFTPSKDGFRYDCVDIINHFNDKNISSLLIINPDNPSGNFIPKDEIINLAEWCKEKNITLIVDESFVDFSEDYMNNTLLDDTILNNYQNLVVIKSISKSFGVPGLRLGIMASANSNLTDSVKEKLAIWNLNSYAEFFMQIFSKHEADYHKACNRFIEERKFLIDGLNKTGILKVFPSQANFLLCEIVSNHTAKELAKELLCSYNILIKDCSGKKGFNGRNFIRLAIRNHEDNIKLIEALNSINK